MLHNIKVFNPKGKLVRVINAQKLYDAKYAEISASIGKTPWGQGPKKTNTVQIVCVICKKEVEGRAKQITCGADYCINERRKIRDFPDWIRKFNCAVCGIEVQTRHHNKKTCGLENCFTVNRDKGEKLRIAKLKEKINGSNRKVIK